MKLPHLEKRSSEIIKTLNSGETVFLTGLAGNGQKRLARYIHEIIRRKGFLSEVWGEYTSVHRKLLIQSLQHNDRFWIFVLTKPTTDELQELIKLNEVYHDQLSLLFVIPSTHIENSPICEKFHGTLFYNPLFTQEETTEIITSREELNEWKVSKQRHQQIYELSSGHAGIIKRLCQYIHDHKRFPENIESLLDVQQIYIKLEELAAELDLLSNNTLRNVGIFDQNPSVQIKLLKMYLRRRKKELSFNEETLLQLFLKSPNKVFTKEDIHFHLGGTYENFSLWRTYKIISRLKQKVAGKYKLKTIKGKGYKFLSID